MTPGGPSGRDVLEGGLSNRMSGGLLAEKTGRNSQLEAHWDAEMIDAVDGGGANAIPTIAAEDIVVAAA